MHAVIMSLVIYVCLCNLLSFQWQDAVWNVHTLDRDREREGRKGGKEEVKHIRRMHLGLGGSSSLAAGLHVKRTRMLTDESRCSFGLLKMV